MFESKCPVCERTFLSRTGSFGKLRCCKQPLPPAVAHVVHSPTIPAPAKTIRVSDKNLTPCVHRGEVVGSLDCGCLGDKTAYKCTKLIRPTADTEPAYCVPYQPIKYFGITLKDGTKLSSSEVPLHEIVVCQRGKCDLYEPTGK
jgi:hypothetical protein